VWRIVAAGSVISVLPAASRESPKPVYETYQATLLTELLAHSSPLGWWQSAAYVRLRRNFRLPYLIFVNLC